MSWRHHFRQQRKTGQAGEALVGQFLEQPKEGGISARKHKQWPQVQKAPRGALPSGRGRILVAGTEYVLPEILTPCGTY